MEMVAAKAAGGKHLCVGLDPDEKQIPEGEGVAAFLHHVVGATADYVAMFKPNIAFFERIGPTGIVILAGLVANIKRQFPDVPVLGDIKRADIGHSVRGYAEMAFEVCGFDAITINPYFGEESLAPFFAYEDKGIIVLCLTSNPGSA